MKNFDAVIIGAGPAGTATALFLAKQGYRVVVLDQAEFPRDKVCGEFISPAADAIFAELGVLALLEAQSSLRLNGVYISAYGKSEVCVDYPPMPGRTGRVTSLSVPRMVLDNVLLQQARRMGAEVRERHKVHDLLFHDGRVVGVKGWDGQKIPFTLKARVVVDAGGRNCVSIRRLNLRQAAKGSGKIALAAHWRGARFRENYCYMHVSPPGYTGIASVGGGSVNVVLVVDSRLLEGRDSEEFYLRAVLGNPRRRQLLADAAPAEKPRTVESLAYSVKSPACGGLALVGDAMGFIDPFTGEGIYLSLRSAQMAAQTVDSAFKTSDFSRRRFAGYEAVRRAEFHKKFVLSRTLQQLIYKPRLCVRVVKILAENPSLAERLVGVIGDYLPAETVVSVKFLARLAAGAIRPAEKDLRAWRNRLQLSGKSWKP